MGAESIGSAGEAAGKITPETLIGRMAIVLIRNFKLPIMGFIKNLGNAAYAAMAAVFAASAARSSVNRLGGTKLVESAKFLKNPTIKKAISYGAGSAFGIATMVILSSRKGKGEEQPVAQEKKEPAEEKK